MLVGAALESCIHDGIFTATISASFKLFLMCGFTGWLLQSGRIPPDSATVLSKASMLILCSSPLNEGAPHWQYIMLRVLQPLARSESFTCTAWDC